jgi:hypothetical protein
MAKLSLTQALRQEYENLFNTCIIPPDRIGTVEGTLVRLMENRQRYGRVEDLQRWLNTFPGIFVKVDGVPGDRTSDAYRQVTGSFLPGDPRAA